MASFLERKGDNPSSSVLTFCKSDKGQEVPAVLTPVSFSVAGEADVWAGPQGSPSVRA